MPPARGANRLYLPSGQLEGRLRPGCQAGACEGGASRSVPPLVRGRSLDLAQGQVSIYDGIIYGYVDRAELCFSYFDQGDDTNTT